MNLITKRSLKGVLKGLKIHQGGLWVGFVGRTK